MTNIIGSKMIIATRTPEGEPNRCPVCGTRLVIEPSRPPGDAPCPSCGNLVWFALLPQSQAIGERVGVEDVSDLEFDSTGWRSGSLKTRGAMSGDLVRRSLLLGLKRVELTAILGEPDEQTDDSYSYCLYRGVRVAFRGSPHRLRIRFGAGRRVSELCIEEFTTPVE